MQHHVSGGDIVKAAVGDEIVLDLVEQSGAGYEWLLTTLPPALEVVRADPPAGAAAPGIGAAVNRRIALRVVAPGRHIVELQHRRSWEQPSLTIGHITLTVDATP